MDVFVRIHLSKLKYFLTYTHTQKYTNYIMSMGLSALVCVSVAHIQALNGKDLKVQALKT